MRIWAVAADARSFGPGAVAGAGLALALSAGSAVAQEPGLVVRRLEFKGNHSIEQFELETRISTTKSSWFARNLRFLPVGELRRLNEREFRRDVSRIRLFYQLSGFLEAQVDTTVIRTDKDVYITFRITEGEPVRVRTLDLIGLDSVPDRERVVRDLPLRLGMPFNRFLLVATADTIQTRLFDRGFPTAAVFVGKRAVDTAANTADVELIADPGRPAVIGPIRVEGTAAVDSSFVRSLLATRPGRPFRYTELYRSQLNLYQAGLFRFASVAVDTTRFTVGDPTVPLFIQVREGPLHRAQAGVGIGTNDCVRSNAGWTARNVGGRGRQVDFAGSISKVGVLVDPFRSTICSGLETDTIGSRKINYSLSASLRRPAFLSPSNAISSTIFAERRSEFRVYLRDEVGTAVTFTREGSRGIPISLSYRLGYGATQATAVSFCAFFLACQDADIAELRRRRFAASLSGTVSRQRVNNLLNPTRGSVYTVEATFSSPLIGSTRFSEFTRLVGEAAWYTPLGSAVVLAGHVRGGVIFAPRLRLQAGAANFVPPEQRFYGGGANDVRGFDRNELGPIVYVTTPDNVDSTGGIVAENNVSVFPVGGNTTAIGNVELRLPSPVFTSRLRWALFVDAGSVWERGKGTPVVAVTPGGGFRFATPLGPMRFDIAYRGTPRPEGPLYSSQDGDLTLLRSLYRKPLGSSFNFQFSVGQAF
ncbi:MAG: outer membrane protein assembly factor [Gemmatimonadales bacterium]